MRFANDVTWLPRRSTLLVLSAVVIGAALAGCGPRGGQTGGAGMGMGRASPVMVAPAMAADVPVYLDEIAHAVASQNVTIAPQITGQVMEKLFEDGADIHKGQPLFTIDKRPFEAALAQAKANVAQAEASLQMAQDQWDHVQGLNDTSAVTKDEYSQRKNGVAVAEAQRKAAVAAVQTAQLNLDYCDIKSPIDGRAGARLVDPGNIVSSSGPNGGSNMLVIQKLDPIYVDFTVSENDLPRVRDAMTHGELTVEARLPEDVQGLANSVPLSPPASQPAATQPMMASTSGDAVPASAPMPVVDAAPTAVTGQVTFMDNAVQNGTGTLKLRATVPNTTHRLWPGQFVNVRLILTHKKDAVLIPVEAEQVGQQGPYVYVIANGIGPDKNPATVAKLRPIVPGQRHGKMLAIDSGIAPGEQVVIVGQMLVMPDAPVMVIDSTKMGGPPGAGGAH